MPAYPMRPTEEDISGSRLVGGAHLCLSSISMNKWGQHFQVVLGVRRPYAVARCTLTLFLSGGQVGATCDNLFCG